MSDELGAVDVIAACNVGCAFVDCAHELVALSG
jgi:hypothetical protein